MDALDPFAQLVGTRLGAGRFIVGERLDEGGMGAVFRAVDTVRGDAVAVKVLFPELARESRHLARFFREAEATMALEHPHIVEMRSLCGPGESLAWFAMELIEGASLHQRQERGQLFSPLEVIRIGRQLLSALAAAHDIGLLHRDVKPANVMLLDGRSATVAKLVDFGIAVFTRSDTYTRLTATGMVLGTPAYMPPEQVCGDPLDDRTDVYSLAATLHTILVGEPPFGRGTWGEILPRILTGARVTLDKRGVESDLAKVIEQGLRTDPSARWKDARAMETALAALDLGGARTVLAWAPPARISATRLAPFDDTGAGFAPTMESGLPGAFPSTRETPSSRPPSMETSASVDRVPSLDPLPSMVADPPPREVERPTRGRSMVIVAAALVSFAVLGVLGVLGASTFGSSNARPRNPPVESVALPTEPSEVEEVEEVEEAEEVATSPTVLPAGLDEPRWTAEEEDHGSSRGSMSRSHMVHRRGRASRERDEAEAFSDPVPFAPIAPLAPAEPAPIRVNIRPRGDMAVAGVRPGVAPGLEETAGTHGPMVRYRGQPR